MTENEGQENTDEYKMNKRQEQMMYWLRYSFKYKRASVRANTGKKIENLDGQVEYFSGKQIIDAIMESEIWGRPNGFQSRENCIAVISFIMSLGTFLRVHKEYKITKENISKKQLSKKKYRLLLNVEEQPPFEDSAEEFYMWNYHPPSRYDLLYAILAIFGSLTFVMYPIWPEKTRQVGYYLGLGGTGFLGLCLGLCLLRSLIYWAIWLLSLGRHHLYILPNLTEDVGFLDSFMPLYSYKRYESKRKKENPVAPGKKNI
ncbi:Oidioi.mRNA.OKI2018_I69.chr1.g3329.t1.cds [Oikopleura dioica]|uniref:Translocation protein SEC62 n=1 Tax=Oikopleura dioica TaxID=34765 RepID=A0ABN7SZ60_OIKDI|nr:Oidioi.mRNA.OKI2018_I69.chr1.g3329.t1.cds [Oikopleura dioica]